MEAHKHGNLPSLVGAPFQQFQPLDKNRDQIRILCLCRGFWSDPISCTSFNAHLEENPPYIALSYVWGNFSNTCLISLNGWQTHVTTNLFAALRRLRRRDEDINLWVDSLCINQRDEDEKSRQVALMGKIYSTTTQGIMWLGDYSEGSLISLLEPTTSGTGETIPRACAIEAFNFLERLASDCHFEGNEIDPIITTRPGAPDNITSLTMLMSLSWWRRIWTVQEVVLPQKVTFQCGYLQLSLETFDKAGQNFTKHNDNGCCPIDDEYNWCLDELVIRMNTIATLREGLHGWRGLIFALNAFSNRFASDKRDKVYGLLGLYPTLFSSSSIDYSLSYADVYTKILIELIKLSGSLLPLLRPRETNPDLSLPSWVPNWATETEDIAPGVWEINFYNDWDAAGGRPATVGITSCTTLPLLGCLVDSIVCSMDERFTDPTTGLSSLIRCFPGSLPLTYPSGGTYVDAFLRSTEITHNAPSKRQRYFLTRNGLLGVSDNQLETGDEVYILRGGNVPFILRPAPTTRSPDRFYTYVGHSYVSGIMEGEVFKENTGEQWVYLL